MVRKCLPLKKVSSILEFEPLTSQNNSNFSTTIFPILSAAICCLTGSQYQHPVGLLTHLQLHTWFSPPPTLLKPDIVTSHHQSQQTNAPSHNGRPPSHNPLRNLPRRTSQIHLPSMRHKHLLPPLHPAPQSLVLMHRPPRPDRLHACVQAQNPCWRRSRL